jgi:AcrR family transcriptional regulator/DNA-binding MarR family transcriptional regulator
VALGLIDALLSGDDETLSASYDALRDARARAGGDQNLGGWLDAAIACAHWGLERLPSQATVASGTQAHDFLSALGDSPHLGSSELRRLLETDETQVSRTARRLLESGLVSRRKVGRQVFWQLTPRGQHAIEHSGSGRQADSSDFWREALRRGFKAASGEEPGEPREVDPTRELIVRSALELHGSIGIQATGWADIAAKSGIPEETLTTLFPTEDDLVRSCGEHFMETLQLPPADLAPEVFTGASTDSERIHRMVETFFAAYERGEAGMEVARRERKAVPIADESLAVLDESLDALVVEAVRPATPDSSSVASLRGLTDLEVWRTLRDGGSAPDAAVEQASSAVERWLKTRTGG